MNILGKFFPVKKAQKLLKSISQYAETEIIILQDAVATRLMCGEIGTLLQIYCWASKRNFFKNLSTYYDAVVWLSFSTALRAGIVTVT